MEKNFKRIIVILVLLYVNGFVYIGYLVGVYVLVDIYVCYLWLKKEDVFFIGGFDEYGVFIIICVKKEGIIL